MTDHPQTATERFIRKAVEGGWKPVGRHSDVYHPKTARGGINLWSHDIAVSIHESLLDPALWRCAGKALRWDVTDGVYDAAWESNVRDSEWGENWHGLLDWLAAHPGDHEGYLGQIIETKH